MNARRFSLLLGLSLSLAPGLSCSSPVVPEPVSAEESIQRATRVLTEARTVQWDMELEVEADMDGLYLRLFPAKQKWHFKVKGPERAYWKTGDRQEGWYTAPKLQLRGADGVQELDFGKEEGQCIVLSIVKGGLVGWLLVHSSWGFEESRVSEAVRERLEGRSAVALRQDFKLNTPGSTDPEFTGCRLWLDAESGLPIQRTYAFLSTGGGEPKSFRARETYSNWKLNEPLPDELFKH